MIFINVLFRHVSRRAAWICPASRSAIPGWFATTAGYLLGDPLSSIRQHPRGHQRPTARETFEQPGPALRRQARLGWRRCAIRFHAATGKATVTAIADVPCRRAVDADRTVGSANAWQRFARAEGRRTAALCGRSISRKTESPRRRIASVRPVSGCWGSQKYFPARCGHLATGSSLTSIRTPSAAPSANRSARSSTRDAHCSR